MASWSFLTNHVRALVYIAHDPDARLRDLAASLGITERSAHAIIANLANAGYVSKQKHGRRNRYQIEAHLPVPEPGTQGTRHQGPRPAGEHRWPRRAGGPCRRGPARRRGRRTCP